MTDPFAFDPDEEEQLEAEVGPPGFWKQTQAFQIRFLQEQGLSDDSRVLDIGCGVLRGGLPLINALNPGRYTGVDVRPSVIDQARALVTRLGLDAKAPTLAVSSAFATDVCPPRSQDFIWAFQVIYHLEDELVQDCFQACSELLAEGGTLYANVQPASQGLQRGQWKEFPFVPREIDQYIRWAEAAGLTCRSLGILADFDYPSQLGGRFNEMLELKRK